MAISFLKAVGMGNVREGFRNYISDDFIHHNQYFNGSRQALLTAMEGAHQSSPNKAVEVKHCYEDKDTVITHSLVSKEDMDIAVVHIFRFKNEKIVELWDLGQPISKDSPNENGLF